MSPRRRELSFGAVGLGVTALSFAILLGLIQGLGWDPHLAYLLQAVVCVELNFVLNRELTWRDRRAGGARGQWLRFHSARALTVPANQLGFSALTLLGVPFLAANAACLAATTVTNYLIAHLWVFRRTEPCSPPSVSSSP